MKKGIGIKTVSLIGALVSILTIIEGTSVILGISTPENIIVPALLYYNVLFGVVGLGVSISLWFNPAKTLQSAVILAALHVTVFIIVTSVHFVEGTTAIESVRAMAIRSIVWIVISIVLRKAKSVS